MDLPIYHQPFAITKPLQTDKTWRYVDMAQQNIDEAACGRAVPSAQYNQYFQFIRSWTWTKKSD